MKSIKRILFFLLVSCLMIPSVTFAATESTNDSFVPIQYELKSEYNMVEDLQNAFRIVEKEEYFTKDGQYQVAGVAPVEGDVRIITYTDVGSGLYIFEQRSGTLYVIKNLTMRLLGGSLGTVEQIILELVKASLSSVDYNKLAKAETRYSYSYPGKKVQVYIGGTWRTRYEVVSRYTWPHIWGYWTPKGSLYPKSYTISKTPDQGYIRPFNTELAPYFNDTNTLIKRARENYYMYDGYWRYPQYWYN